LHLKVFDWTSRAKLKRPSKYADVACKTTSRTVDGRATHAITVITYIFNEDTRANLEKVLQALKIL